MAIIFDKLFLLLKERNLTMYTLRRDKVIGVETLEKNAEERRSYRYKKY